MSFVKNTQPNRMGKASKRVLLGETREEEAARLEQEIAAHPARTGYKRDLSGPKRSAPPLSIRRPHQNTCYCLSLGPSADVSE